MLNNKSFFGPIYCSHIKPNNHHAFITTNALTIPSSMHISLGQSIFTEITHTTIYIPKEIYFHERSHFGDMLLQLIHLKIYINIQIFEFKIALNIIFRKEKFKSK